MPLAQAQKSSLVTAQESMVLVRNLIRTSVSTVTYLRNIFPDEAYTDRKISGINIKSLLANSEETRTLIDWLEKGVFDALQKQYLRILSLVVTDAAGDVVENYDFRVSYPAAPGGRGGASTALALNCSHGGGPPTKSDAASSMKVMLRKLIVLTQSMAPLPEERTVTMKLVYDPDTPEEYEAPYFMEASEEARKQFTRHDRHVVDLKLGQIKTQYHIMDLRCRAPEQLLDGPAATNSEAPPGGASQNDLRSQPSAAGSTSQQDAPATAHGLYALLDGRRTTVFQDRLLQAYIRHGVIQRDPLTPPLLADVLDVSIHDAARAARQLQRWELCGKDHAVAMNPATKAHVERIMASGVASDLDRRELSVLEERLVDDCSTAPAASASRSRKRARSASPHASQSQGHHGGPTDSFQAYGDEPKISEIERPLKQFRAAAAQARNVAL